MYKTRLRKSEKKNSFSNFYQLSSIYPFFFGHNKVLYINKPGRMPTDISS